MTSPNSRPDKKLYKEIIGVSIERTLLGIGLPVLMKVERTLKEDYDCSFADCFEYPEYLRKILKDLYGNSYEEIVESIKNHVGEFRMNSSVKSFITVMENNH